MSRLISSRSTAVSILALTCLAAVAAADDGLKKPLDHSSYDQWNAIGTTQLSRDGKWLLYTLQPGKGDATLKVRELSTQREFVIQRGTSARFSYDSRYMLCIVQPDPEAVKAARKAKKPAHETPQPSLLILDLQSGKTRSLAEARSFSLPDKASGWVAISRSNQPAPVTAAQKSSAVKQVEQIAGTAGASEQPSAKPAEKSPPPKAATPEAKTEAKKPSDKSSDKKKSPGSDLVLLNLETGLETTYPFVTAHRLSEDGRHLALAISVQEGQTTWEDGVTVVQIPDLKARVLVSGRGNYRNLTFDESGEKLAFLTDRDSYADNEPVYALYCAKSAGAKPVPVVTGNSESIPKGWQIPESSRLQFSQNGQHLFFTTAPHREEEAAKPAEDGKKPAEEEAKSAEEDEKPVKVDIWHWQDPLLQPMQLRLAEMEKRRTYSAVVHLQDNKVLQLANQDMPLIVTGNEGNARYALGISDLPYRKLISWDYPAYQDAFLVDTLSGKAVRVLEKAPSLPSWSPQARYLVWWDPAQRGWFGMSVSARQPIALSAHIPHAMHDELHDEPSPPRGYGLGGWTDNDREVLIYDRFDIWAVNPLQPDQPRCITDGVGRQTSTQFRIRSLDREARSVPPQQPIYLSAFQQRDKSSGFYRDQVAGDTPPQQLIMKDEQLSSLQKAEQSNTIVFTRSTFQRFPDLWTSTLDFREIKQISQANPQQLNYRWGSAELTQWKSATGQTLQGILYKPEDFDPQQKYPLLVYFYERNSDTLHRYIVPAASRSIINFSFYVSRGYVLFVPDIPYRIGHPGKSAEDAVLPGIASVVAKGFIDEKTIGVQGHSWGGYQVAHLVTRTNIFAAAEAGAPVSNMTSAYGGIRWGSGMSRMFQYERTQSRIGGTLWNARDLYIENSPLFHADKIHTPLLILHNDKDGAVPWYQGIELFVALRRLSKPAWLVNYNDEDHGVMQDQNRRDWSVRMQQFFDHYLQGKPAPKWLTEGVPATEKGKTLGLETDS